MKITVALPTLCRADLLKEAAKPLLRNRKVFCHFLVIDNGWQALEWAMNQGIDIYRTDRNLGYAGSCNLAIERTLIDIDADWLLFHSDDVVLSDESVAGLPELCERHRDKWLVRSKASWSVVLLSREGVEAMRYAPGKYLDEAFWPGQFEDLDFEWRMRLLDESRLVTREAALFPAVWRRKQSHDGVPNFRGHRRRNRDLFLSKWGSIHPKNRYTIPFDGVVPWPQ